MIFSRAWPLKEAQQVIRHRAVCQTGKEQDSKTQHKRNKSLTCDVKIVVSKRVSLGLGAWDLTIRFTRHKAYEPITAVWKQKEHNSWRDREKRYQAEMSHCNGRANNWIINRVQSALLEIEHCEYEYLVQDSWSDKPFTILEQRELHYATSKLQLPLPSLPAAALCIPRH